jgi:hypothetical protein
MTHVFECRGTVSSAIIGCAYLTLICLAIWCRTDNYAAGGILWVYIFKNKSIRGTWVSTNNIKDVKNGKKFMKNEWNEKILKKILQIPAPVTQATNWLNKQFIDLRVTKVFPTYSQLIVYISGISGLSQVRIWREYRLLTPCSLDSFVHSIIWLSHVRNFYIITRIELLKIRSYKLFIWLLGNKLKQNNKFLLRYQNIVTFIGAEQHTLPRATSWVDCRQTVP